MTHKIDQQSQLGVSSSILGGPQMGDPCPQLSPARSTTGTSAAAPPSPLPVSLVEPSPKKKRRDGKTIRVFRSIFRSFPILTPTACKFPALPGGALPDPYRGARTANKLTGTLFGYRKGRVSLSMQENSRCLPTLVLQLAVQMSVLQKDLSSGMVRIALECERQAENAPKEKRRLMVDELVWTMYYNGKKTGYGIKREAAEEDLYLMELLKAVSMGAGVLPARNGASAGGGDEEGDDDDGELMYMRTQFEHVVGSKDSETLYMLSPEGNTGPDLTIFMVRL